jgi:cytoskeleton protein RodZ
MTEDVDTQAEADRPENPGPVAGERLAEARRTQQVSIDEIAKELHLDEHKVRALERNEFDVLGAPVFAKGYLRKYAQLVGVRVEDVLADYHHLTRAVVVPPVISSRQRPRQELSPGPWIAVIVVVIVAATAYWWFTRPAPPPAREPAAVEATEATDAPDTETVEVEPAAAEPEPDDTGAEPEETPAPPVEAATLEPAVEESTTPEVIPGQMRLLLSYTGDCWTEITDANGRRLLFDLGKDGRTVELSGVEPFNVLFGNPGNVIVRVNGEDFALPPTNRPDRPMRLTISGN